MMGLTTSEPLMCSTFTMLVVRCFFLGLFTTDALALRLFSDMLSLPEC